MRTRETRVGQRAAAAGRARRRWGLALGAVALAVGASAASLALDRDPGDEADPGPAASPVVQPSSTLPVATPTTLPPPPELPRGGRRLFPRHTVVGFYGMQGLDVLGAGAPDVVAQRLLKVASPYARPGRPVMPMFELIATVAHPFPTPSGLYRTHQEDEIVQGYLEAVRRIDGVLVLTCSRAGTTSWPRCATGSATCASPTSGSPSTPSSPWARPGPGHAPGPHQRRCHQPGLGLCGRDRGPPPAAREAVHDPPVPRQHDAGQEAGRDASRPGHDLERRRVRGPLGQARRLPVLHPRPSLPSRPEAVLRERRRPDVAPGGHAAQAGPAGGQLPATGERRSGRGLASSSST
jgi:hypothetical protein